MGDSYDPSKVPMTPAAVHELAAEQYKQNDPMNQNYGKEAERDRKLAVSMALEQMERACGPQEQQMQGYLKSAQVPRPATAYERLAVEAMKAQEQQGYTTPFYLSVIPPGEAFTREHVRQILIDSVQLVLARDRENRVDDGWVQREVAANDMFVLFGHVLAQEHVPADAIDAITARMSAELQQWMALE